MGDEEFCRLCAETKPLIDLLNINDECCAKQNLENNITQLFQITITSTDKLPKTICFKCCEKVNVTSDFYRKVQQAQETLRSILTDEDSVSAVSGVEYDSDQLAENFMKIEKREGSPPIEIVECVLSDSIANQSNLKMRELETETVEKTISEITKRKKKLVRHKDSSDKRRPARPKTRKSRKKSVNESEDQGSESDDDNLSVLSGASGAERNEDGSLNIGLQGWESYPWMCVECDEKLNSMVELRNHHQTIHNQIPKYVCVECPKMYTKYYGFISHVRFHRKYLRFSCDACYKFFENKKVLEVHRATHFDARPYVCTTCGKSFRMQSALYVHARSHLPVEVKNKYPCDQCPKRFGTKPNLMAHKRIHTGIRDYTCDQCGKSFIQKGNLDNHMLTHINARPFSCDTCGKSFKTLMRLKKHGSVHSDLKPHQCDVCGRQFRERGTLKEHHRIHTGAMPYKCEFCGKSFRFKGVLTTHRRQHTGERPYSCQECQHHFTNWPNYNKHMKRRHGINTSVTTRKPQAIPPTGMPNRNPPGTVVDPTASHVFVIQESNVVQAAPTGFVDQENFVAQPVNIVNSLNTVNSVNTTTVINQRERVLNTTLTANANGANLTGSIVNMQPSHVTQNYYMLHGLYNIQGMNTEIMQHAQHQ